MAFADLEWILDTIPTMEELASGKYKGICYIVFEDGNRHFSWTTKEEDADISEANLLELDRIQGTKVESLAIFKLHKVFRRDKVDNDTSDEGNTTGD